MPVNTFYGRTKIRLPDFRAVRVEMCRVYRACIAQEIDWDAGRSAAVVLGRIAGMDETAGIEARIALLEQAAGERQPDRRATNGRGRHDAHP